MILRKTKTYEQLACVGMASYRFGRWLGSEIPYAKLAYDQWIYVDPEHEGYSWVLSSYGSSVARLEVSDVSRQPSRHAVGVNSVGWGHHRKLLTELTPCWLPITTDESLWMRGSRYYYGKALRSDSVEFRLHPMHRELGDYGRPLEREELRRIMYLQPEYQPVVNASNSTWSSVCATVGDVAVYDSERSTYTVYLVRPYLSYGRLRHDVKRGMLDGFGRHWELPKPTHSKQSCPQLNDTFHAYRMLKGDERPCRHVLEQAVSEKVHPAWARELMSGGRPKLAVARIRNNRLLYWLSQTLR